MSPRSLPALHRLLPRVYYGWVVALGSSLLSFVTVGVGFYGMPVLLDGLIQVHGWSRASVSGATSLYFVTAAVVGSGVGRGIDRRGARGFIAIGAALMAGALVAIGRLEGPGALLPLYALMAAGFAASGAVPTHAILTRWFVARRALAMSIGQTGVSLGGMVLVPLATGLIETQGLAAATWTLACILVGVALPVVLLVLRFDPRPYGLAPDGPGAPPPRSPYLAPEAQRRSWTARQALATSTFWLLAFAFAIVLFAQTSLSVHQIAFLREPLGATGAALAVSTTAAGSVVARLVVGSFADLVDKRLLAVALVLLQAAVYLGLSFATTPAALYLAALLFGFTIGNLFMLQSLLVGEFFGLVSFGTVLGMLQLATQLGGGLGPLSLGLLAEGLGGYAPALRVLGGLVLVAALLLLCVRAPRPPTALPPGEVG